jgi:hypothetical protein
MTRLWHASYVPCKEVKEVRIFIGCAQLATEAIALARGPLRESPRGCATGLLRKRYYFGDVLARWHYTVLRAGRPQPPSRLGSRTAS